MDLANLSRVFRGIAGDFDWLPQHCRIPPEKQRQHYERQRKPNRQPDQRAAEGFFGAASIAQRAQQERKKQAYQAVAEIECNTLERKLPSNTRTTINRDRRRDRFQSRLFIF